MFQWQVAWRYLSSNLLQTALLVAGVALGVVAFVFITALINGLAIVLTAETTGSIAHITLQPPVHTAPVLNGQDDYAATPVSTSQRRQIRDWQNLVSMIEQTPGVISVRPEIDGNGFLVRGEAVAPVAVKGIEPEKLSVVVPIAGNLVRGRAELSAGSLLIGARLAHDLGLTVGQPLILRTERDRERLLTVSGIFETGIANVDERIAYLNLRSARPLFDLPDGVTQLSIKLSEPAHALALAPELAALTRLRATPWQEQNRNLEEALAAQGTTGTLIQLFAMISIVIGVASALLLSTYRRRSEIGIMRSFGITRRFVATVFLLQGLLVGLIGGLSGALAGYGLCLWLYSIRQANGDPVLPLAPDQGGYLLVILLTTLGAVLAAVLPARAAAMIDPLEAIQQ
jgi:lipoprotein-releasing system permease protein